MLWSSTALSVSLSVRLSVDVDHVINLCVSVLSSRLMSLIYELLLRRVRQSVNILAMNLTDRQQQAESRFIQLLIKRHHSVM